MHLRAMQTERHQQRRQFTWSIAYVEVCNDNAVYFELARASTTRASSRVKSGLGSRKALVVQQVVETR